MLDLKLTISEVDQIFNEIKTLSGFDFENYAFSLKMRRIVSFMNTENITSTDDFIFRLRSSENSVSNFVKSLFIPQSELFRDAELWNYLHEKLLLKLLSKKEVKIHIPSCISGEDLYSLMFLLGLYQSSHVTILVSYPLSENKDFIKNRIFTQKDLKACQKNIENLDFANNTEDVFLGHTNQMRINHLYRGKIEFEHCITENLQHLTEFDLILFRNRLICYNEYLQDEILRKISAGLKKGGLLIIGERETLGQLSGKFKKLKPNLSIFKKKIF